MGWSGVEKLLLVGLLFPGPIAVANVVGTDLQNFNGSPGGVDYVTVHAAETLEPGIFHLGLMTNYAVNSLPFYSDEAKTQNRLRANDSLLTSEVLVGVGVWKNFEIGMASSRVMRQRVDNTSTPHGQLSGPGWTNYRLHLKAFVYDGNFYRLAVSASNNFNNIDKNPYMGRDVNSIHHFEMIGDTKFGDLSTAVNIGYRCRRKGAAIVVSNITPTADQMIASVGASYLLPIADTKLITEIFSSRPVGRPNSNNNRRQASSMEQIFGLKHDLSTTLALHFGGGTEMINGAASPDWRLYSGINWNIEPSIPLPDQQPFDVKEEADEAVVIIYRLEFEFDSDQLTSASKEVLGEVVGFIKSQTYGQLVVEGHTDSVGKASYNQVLSERRAGVVAALLIADYQIKPGQIKAIGYGESKPISHNDNYQGRRRNRRVEIRIKR